TYQLMSDNWFLHAPSTLINAGTCKPQLASSFCLPVSDSVTEIYDTVKRCALICKHSGNIGLGVQNIRALGSYISGTNSDAKSIIQNLRIFNAMVCHVDSGVDSGGRQIHGRVTVYIEPWHADICDYLDAKKQSGKEELRAHNLDYALWIPDLFMKRVETNQDWTLMCPNECPGLDEVWGKEFEDLYLKYESDNCCRNTIKAQELWKRIIEAQTETGTPYMLYKDACNRKSNHQNLGTIKCSNLCTEIVEFSSPDE
ncbi:ribonucleoside-diphosphate reductase large subunit-like, partial [Saccoglossus kowalevskii]|uniref:Ribonucleoside-diphosphate reductase large subunit-like n=1 Tax=Saccoglossus kowalevskii TaxID=10224 RepID=A0ABM0M349_SACKO